MLNSVFPHQGASILLMLKSTLTDEEFRKGVIEYLQAHKFQNTKSEDLWNSLTNVRPFLNQKHFVNETLVFINVYFHVCVIHR